MCQLESGDDACQRHHLRLMGKRGGAHPSLLLLGLLLLPRSAGAAETLEKRETVWDRPLSIALVTGLGTPNGLAGATLDVTPIRYLTLGGGGGMAIDGLQQEGHARLRIPIGAGAVTLGGGVSTGPYLNHGGKALCSIAYEGVCWHRRWERAWWKNVDVAFEMRTRDGFELRTFLGVAGQVDTPETECVVTRGSGKGACGAQTIAVLPYLGVSFGYVFDK